MNTTTKKTIYTVNGTKYDSNFIEFRETTGYSKNMLPTRQCFVHVWQRSFNLPEFYENMIQLYDLWLEDHQYGSHYNTKAFGLTPSYVTRSRTLCSRNKVKLKELPKANDWISLRKLAKNSLAQL